MATVSDSNALGPFVTPPVAAATVAWAPFKSPADSLTASDWYDITPYVIGIPNVRRGRQYELNQFQAGTAQIVLDNNGRDFDPMLVSTSMGSLSPTVKGGASAWSNTNLVPLKRFQIQVFYQDATGQLDALFGDPSTNTTFPVFTGYAEGFPPEWQGVDYGQTTITLTDAFRLLQGIYVGPATTFPSSATTGYTGSGTAGTLASGRSGQQIAAILDAIGWPGAGAYMSSGNRVIDPGLTTCVAQTLTSNVTALSVIQNIADTEFGQFFVAADGSLTFHDRGHRWTSARSLVPQGTFSDKE